MPQSEAVKLAGLWTRLFRGEPVVCVGGAKWRLPEAQIVASLDELTAAPRSAIGWCAPEAPPLGRLRRALVPGGILAVVTHPPDGALHKLWPWHAPEPDDAELTSALVLHGYLEPARVRCADGAVLVHGRVPAEPSALDAIFDNLA